MKKIFFLLLLLMITQAFSKEFKIATWNVVAGKKLFTSKSNYPKIEDVITNGDLKGFDFITITEQGDADQVAQIAHRAGYFYFEGTWGNGILSKYKIIKTGDVIVNPNSIRRAAWADVELNDGRHLRIYALHLSYKVKFSPFIPKIREQELLTIIKHSRNFNGPIILAGDFNTVRMIPIFLRKKPVLKLAKRNNFKNAFRRKRCWTHIMGQLDWIFVKGAKKFKKSKCGKFAGSDHRYVYTTVTI